MSGQDEQRCVVCGVHTGKWVRGWDYLIRCVEHAAEGPQPLGKALSEYLITGDEGHVEVTHERCGEQVLLTLRVHADTIARIARDHTCQSAPGIQPTP